MEPAGESIPHGLTRVSDTARPACIPEVVALRSRGLDRLVNPPPLPQPIHVAVLGPPVLVPAVDEEEVEVLHIEDDGDDLEAIRAAGPGSCILSTDLGQTDNPAPAEGLRMFIAGMLREEFSAGQVSAMVKNNPGQLLGLG